MKRNAICIEISKEIIEKGMMGIKVVKDEKERRMGQP